MVAGFLLFNSFKFTWLYHFTKKGEGDAWSMNLIEPRHFSSECLYQDRKVSGHVNVC